MRREMKKNLILLLVLVLCVVITSYIIVMAEQRASVTFKGRFLIFNINGVLLILFGIILGLDIFRAKWKGMKLTYDYKKAITLGLPLFYLAIYYYISLIPFNIIRMYFRDLDMVLIRPQAMMIFQILFGYVMGTSLMLQEREKK